MKKLKKLVVFLLSIKLIRKTYEALSLFITRLGSFSRLSSVVYHWVGFFSFSREQYAVLHGRKNYYKNLNKQRKSRSELRRNTHRLEKGLLMRPRRKVFAKDYIGETVEFYEKALRDYKNDDSGVDISELIWAQNVLTEYFSKVSDEDKAISKLHDQFKKIDFAPKDIDKKPYKRGNPKSPIKYEDLLELSHQRRSVRWFKQKPVPRELIDKALLVAEQSPSACNRLPYEFKIYDDPKLVKKVAAIPFGAAGYRDNIPTIIVVVGKQENYFSPRDRHLIYVDSALSVMPFMYALETLGLASSSINWPDFEPLEAKMQKTLGLSPDERPIMLIALGYADPEGYVAYSQKKSLDVLRTYNKIGK
ncbi:MAG TPA: nitroreductase family protein [Candidatus Saccharimonadales bacterium]|nr:nitroreductase family protein [Candidatus Saccharimonadales bacterium]